MRLGRALLNLSDALAVTDPAAAAETARTAAGHLRRVGARDYLAFAIRNLAQALLMLGDWDAAERELTQAADSDGLADYRVPRLLPGLAGGAARRRRRRRDHAGRHCGTCGPAKTPRTRR